MQVVRCLSPPIITVRPRLCRACSQRPQTKTAIEPRSLRKIYGEEEDRLENPRLGPTRQENNPGFRPRAGRGSPRRIGIRSTRRRARTHRRRPVSDRWNWRFRRRAGGIHGTAAGSSGGYRNGLCLRPASGPEARQPAHRTAAAPYLDARSGGFQPGQSRAQPNLRDPSQCAHEPHPRCCRFRRAEFAAADMPIDRSSGRWRPTRRAKP